jgi:hypothetical protein
MEKEDGRAMGSAVCSIELTFVTQKMPLLHRTYLRYTYYLAELK